MVIAGNDNLQWDEVEGVRNLNRELIKNRAKYKFFVERIFGVDFVNYLKYLRSRPKLKEFVKMPKPQLQIQESKKVAIIFVGTNKYVKFFPRFYKSIKKFFLPNTYKDFFVFTDQVKDSYIKGKKDVKIIPIKHQGTSFATLLRFKHINSIADKLKKYSHIFYIDSDMFANCLVTEQEFFCHDKSLFAIYHPCFLNAKGQFELNPLSTAALTKKDDKSAYRQCCFWGGESKELLKMCKKLDKNIETDLRNSIIAVWLDESHLNKYFIRNVNKVHTYDSGYGYPEQWPVPKGFRRKFIHGKGDILK
jgi:hypothetical protein